jgi:hypothetical protein
MWQHDRVPRTRRAQGSNVRVFRVSEEFSLYDGLYEYVRQKPDEQ